TPTKRKVSSQGSIGEQSQKYRCRVSTWNDGHSDGSVRLWKIHPCKRYTVQGTCIRDLWFHRQARKTQGYYRNGRNRQGHRNRPVPNRAYSTLKSCHIHRCIYANQGFIRRNGTIKGTRVYSRTVLV